MSHIPLRNIHAYRNRGLDLRIDVDTDLDPTDFSAITFRIGSVEITGLSASSGGSGVLIDFTLTAANTNSLAVGSHLWECLATVSGEVRTLATGWFHLETELTAAP